MIATPEQPEPDATAPNAAFSKTNPKLQIAWDTVSTGALKTCPRYYQYSIIEGWTPRGVNPHLLFGLVMHSAREVYDRASAAGADHNEALRAAVTHGLEASGERQECLKCCDCGTTRELPHPDRTATSPPLPHGTWLDILCLSCGSEDLEPLLTWTPWASDDKNKNLRTLIRTIVWYFDHYKDAPEETVRLADGTPAVELWFRFEIPLRAPDGTHYMLTGHLDRLINIFRELRFSDIKTTKSTIRDNYFASFSPDNQMSQYSLGGAVVFDRPIAGGVIDAAQIAISFTRFQRGFLNRTPAQLEEWLRDIQIWIKQAEGYAKANYWPMNDKACHHYGGCDFREVCSKSPAVRQHFLRTKFAQRPWEPLKPRPKHQAQAASIP